MLLANYLGGGRYKSAMALMREGRTSGVRQDELDRWIVLSGITPILELGDEKAQAAAASRLRTTRIDPLVARWLAVRWYMRHDPEQAAEALQDFKRLVPRRDLASSLELSLTDDLSAVDRLTNEDTTGALAAWRLATQRFSIEQVPFSLAASLWPLRISRARLLLANRRYRDALEVSGTFLRITAYVDQAAWPEILPLRADAALQAGDTAMAMITYQDLVSLLELADGDGIAIREV